MTILYRAASAADPYFGLRSYWTLSPDFAQAFAAFAEQHPAWPGSMAVYRAEVDLSSEYAFNSRCPSDFVGTLTRASAPLRKRAFGPDCRWVSFIEKGDPDGLPLELARLAPVTRQYVYLGEEAIRPTP